MLGSNQLILWGRGVQVFWWDPNICFCIHWNLFFFSNVHKAQNFFLLWTESKTYFHPKVKLSLKKKHPVPHSIDWLMHYLVTVAGEPLGIASSVRWGFHSTCHTIHLFGWHSIKIHILSDVFCPLVNGVDQFNLEQFSSLDMDEDGKKCHQFALFNLHSFMCCFISLPPLGMEYQECHQFVLLCSFMRCCAHSCVVSFPFLLLVWITKNAISLFCCAISCVDSFPSLDMDEKQCVGSLSSIQGGINQQYRESPRRAYFHIVSHCLYIWWWWPSFLLFSIVVCPLLSCNSSMGPRLTSVEIHF